MNVMIVEDDPNKLKHLTDFVREIFPLAEIRELRSYQSGLKAALQRPPGLIVLDMTLPNYDVSPDEKGGKTRPFAGREILSELARKSVRTRVVVVTQFETFGEGAQRTTLSELDAQLKRDFDGLYEGAVYYNPAQSAWRRELLEIAVRSAEDESVVR